MKLSICVSSLPGLVFSVTSMTAVMAVMATAATGCGSGATSEGAAAASISQRIVKGTASDASQESVVRLDIDDEFACTGTLIAPNLLLTARHCVAEIEPRGMCGTFAENAAPKTLSISTGIDAKPTGVKGKAVFTEDTTDACTTDIALVVLESSVPNAKTSKVRLTPLTVGEDALTVGYGDDGTGASFDKLPPREQRAGLHVDAIGPTTWTYQTKTGESIPVELSDDEIATGESTCVGDSGGPLFDKTGQVIAVTSRGVDEECVDRPSVYAAVAKHEGLIKKAFEAAGLDVEGEAVAPTSAPPSASPAPEAPTPTSAIVASGPPAGDSGCSTSGAGRLSSANLAFAAAGLVAIARTRRARAKRA